MRLTPLMFVLLASCGPAKEQWKKPAAGESTRLQGEASDYTSVLGSAPTGPRVEEIGGCPSLRTKRLNLTTDREPAGALLTSLAEAANLEIVLPAKADRPVTIAVVDTPIVEAITQVAAAAKLSVSVEQCVITLTPLPGSEPVPEREQ